MQINRFSLGRERGDTIVEVLIAVAIISLVLTAAYASANRNVAVIRDTQEHSQALQLVQGQIEYLRTKAAPSAGGCFDASGAAASAAGCIFNGDGTADTTGNQPAYTLSINAAGSNVYKVSANWDSILGRTDAVDVYYEPPR